MYFIDLQLTFYHENLIFEKLSQLFSKAITIIFRIYYYHLENLLHLMKKILQLFRKIITFI